MDLQKLALEYISAKEEADKAKAKQDELSNLLKEQLALTGEIELEAEEKVVKLVSRETISFDVAILPYLKTNGLETYIREVADDSGLKKAIKSSEMFAEQLKDFTKIKVSQALVVGGR